jgi:hypothetical protein
MTSKLMVSPSATTYRAYGMVQAALGTYGRCSKRPHRRPVEGRERRWSVSSVGTIDHEIHLLLEDGTEGLWSVTS